MYLAFEKRWGRWVYKADFHSDFQVEHYTKLAEESYNPRNIHIVEIGPFDDKNEAIYNILRKLNPPPPPQSDLGVAMIVSIMVCLVVSAGLAGIFNRGNDACMSGIISAIISFVVSMRVIKESK